MGYFQCRKVFTFTGGFFVPKNAAQSYLFGSPLFSEVKIPSKNALAQHMEGLRFLKVQDLQADMAQGEFDGLKLMGLTRGIVTTKAIDRWRMQLNDGFFMGV